MELVYLYINNHYEEHKNSILNDSNFNFSPKFNCKYKNKCLEIIGKNYIDNFFENKKMNFTVIVGANGSGKSTILKTILEDGFGTSDYKKNDDDFKYIKILYDSSNNTIFINSNIRNIEKKTLIKNFSGNRSFNEENDIFYYYYSQNYDLAYQWDTPNNGFAYYDTQKVFIEPNKNNNILNLEIEKEKSLKKIIFSMNEKYIYGIDTKKFATPFLMNYEAIDTRLVDKEILEKYRDDDENNILSKIDNLFINSQGDINIRSLLVAYNIIYFYKLTRPYNQEIGKKDILNLNFDNLFEYKSYCIEYIKLIKKNEQLYKKHEYSYDKNLYLSEVKKVNDLFKKLDIDNNFFIDVNFDSGTATFYLKENQSFQEEEIDVLINLPRFLVPNIMFHGYINYEELSTGEKSLLDLIYSLKSIIFQRLKLNAKSIFILLDEIESFLNPQWQKKVIFYLVNFFKNNDISLHFIMTTHSPFLLSDLPKENIIFLEKGKQAYPFENGQTFGANIHTLLSHGFFMEGGLMGEFAKGKITEIIEILKKEQLSEDEIKTCKHIISIIGEPILQKTLEHQLSGKLNPNETELQKLEREQKEIQAKIDKLKGNQ